MTNDEERQPLRGKVAAIVSNRAIAINLGADDGVKPGTRFAVLYQTSPGLQIKDPDTGEDLGRVAVPKVVVKVFQVSAAHLCVARTYRKILGTASKPAPFSQVLLFGERPGTPDLPETLEIDDANRIDRLLDPQESYVEVGDPVIEARGDEFDGYSDYK